MSMTKEKNRRAAVLRGLECSGLSMAEFCRREGLPYGTVAGPAPGGGTFYRSGKRRCSDDAGGGGRGGGALRRTGAACRRGAADFRPRRRGGRCGVIFTRGLRVCLAAQPADLRRSFEGLVLLVKGALCEDERSSQIFVFTNKRRDRVRLLYWAGTGLC